MLTANSTWMDARFTKLLRIAFVANSQRTTNMSASQFHRARVCARATRAAGAMTFPVALMGARRQ